MTTHLKLDERPGAAGPVFVGSYSIADAKNVGPWEPGIGDVVTLKSGTVSIIARIAAAHAGPHYEGFVMGFEGWDGESFAGLQEGGPIAFNGRHIFGCQR